ncbi:hypothetical protein [Bifidobacterium platyrrhinorum]|uniref:Head fiber protein n=1 Tax=Bifidobacterium platyrrhinorum TaxID=2661628 RepID=A0A6L9SQH9_9BIFI|nr:hypothetical protein [Bifidobacterium platyrrhinorum]NEG54754.1 hypothetical protein [Bifidobacterium platyrrhinorum]
MSVTPVKTLVVQTGDSGVPVLAEPVRLINPDGTPFTGASAAVTVDTLSGASSIGKAVMKASTGAGARTAIGAGTSNFSGAYGDLTGKPTIPTMPTAATLSGATTVGKAVMTAADAATARKAIGAGTSSFTGSYTDLTNKPTIPTAPTWATISGKPAAAAAIADLAAGADAAAIVTAVNKAFAALRTFGVIAK